MDFGPVSLFIHLLISRRYAIRTSIGINIDTGFP